MDNLDWIVCEHDKTKMIPTENLLFTFHLIHLSSDDLQPSIYGERLSLSSDHTKDGYSRNDKIFGLLEQRVFLFVMRALVERNSLFNIPFCDYVKEEGLLTTFEKSPFVFMINNDTDHGHITYTSTVQRSSQCLLSCMTVCDVLLHLFKREITQAYLRVQSSTNLSRVNFVEPSKF